MKQTPKILAALFLGAVVLAACSSSPSKSASTTTTTLAHHSTTTSSAAGTTSTITTTTAAAAATTTSTTLAATAQVKSSITAAYVAHNGLPAAQVAGPAPGTVYYAYVPATKTYWAIASFEPTPGADMQTQVSMQDDGCCGIFTSSTGTTFTDAGGFLGEPCPGQIPAALFTLWQIHSPGDCP